MKTWKNSLLFSKIYYFPFKNTEILEKVEKLINEFVEELPELYGESIMLSGIHEMLHLVDCTLAFGPLNSIL